LLTQLSIITNPPYVSSKFSTQYTGSELVDGTYAAGQLFAGGALWLSSQAKYTANSGTPSSFHYVALQVATTPPDSHRIHNVALWPRLEPNYKGMMGQVQVWISPTGQDFQPSSAHKCGDVLSESAGTAPFVANCPYEGEGYPFVVVQQVADENSLGYFSLLEVVVLGI